MQRFISLLRVSCFVSLATQTHGRNAFVYPPHTHQIHISAHETNVTSLQESVCFFFLFLSSTIAQTKAIEHHHLGPGNGNGPKAGSKNSIPTFEDLVTVGPSSCCCCCGGGGGGGVTLGEDNERSFEHTAVNS
jgi:hypothetical protein